MADEEHKQEHVILTTSDPKEGSKMLDFYVNNGWIVRAHHHYLLDQQGYPSFCFIFQRCASCAAKQVPHVAATVRIM